MLVLYFMVIISTIQTKAFTVPLLILNILLQMSFQNSDLKKMENKLQGIFTDLGSILITERLCI